LSGDHRQSAPAALRAFLLAAMLCLLSGSSFASDTPPETGESLEQRLEKAKELNVTAPWRENEALLDEIESSLAEATPRQRADYWLLRARNQTLAGHMQTALETLEDLFDEQLTLRQRMRANTLAANVAMLLRRWEATFAYLNRALELSERLGEHESEPEPASLAAYLYAQLGETERAAEYGKQAVAAARASGNARDVCIDQGRLAFVYKTADRREMALEHYREALAACTEGDDELVRGIVESGLADLLRAMGRVDEARDLFQSALTRLEGTDYRYGLGEARLYKARLHWREGEHEQVRALLDQALASLEGDEAWDYVAEAHGMLADIAADHGDHEAALAHMRRQLEARERFLDLERSRQIAHLQVAFDTRSREQELALLREQRRSAGLEKEARRQSTQLQWMLYGFAILLFLVLLLLLAHVLRDRRHFRRLAGLDSLTGLSNHTHFFDSARVMIDSAGFSGQPLVLALGDMDYFKRVNDEFGHIAGDRALVEVARVLRRHAPTGALVGRIGGEEFALCLPGETIASTEPYLDAIRDALARIDYGDGGMKPLTMSFGLAELAKGERLQDIRRRADRALYGAKRGGRNTVKIAPSAGD
jgi:diguanylate cyclase (GGDEF)-like protein